MQCIFFLFSILNTIISIHHFVNFSKNRASNISIWKLMFIQLPTSSRKTRNMDICKKFV